MIATLVISIITFILITISILFFPTFKIRHLHISSFWVVALVRACLLLICQLVPFDRIRTELTSDGGINPLKIKRKLKLK